jgi:hypothetical protein
VEASLICWYIAVGFIWDCIILRIIKFRSELFLDGEALKERHCWELINQIMFKMPIMGLVRIYICYWWHRNWCLLHYSSYIKFFYFEEFCHLGCNAVQPGEIQPTFWTNMLPPSLGSKSAGRVYFMLVCCLAYSSTLNIEAVCSSQSLVGFHQTTWHFTPEDRTLHSHCCENLKSNIFFFALVVIICHL